MSTPEFEPLVIPTEKDGITPCQFTIDGIFPYFEAVDAEWRSQGNPDDQIIDLFDAIWELRNDETEGSIARTAFTLAFMDDRSDGKWGDIFGATSYYGKNELLRVVESMCREGSFSAGYGPEHLATFLTNLVYVTYATWEMMPGQGLQDKNEWLDTIRGYLK